MTCATLQVNLNAVKFHGAALALASFPIVNRAAARSWGFLVTVLGRTMACGCHEV